MIKGLNNMLTHHNKSPPFKQRLSHNYPPRKTFGERLSKRSNNNYTVGSVSEDSMSAVGNEKMSAAYGGGFN